MRNKLFTFVLLMLLAVPGFSQTATTRTALSAALTNNATTVSLLSVTGISASTVSNQHFIMVGLEQMQVVSVNTTAVTVQVLRGRAGFQTAHPANEPVFYGDPATFNTGTGNVGGAPGNPQVGGGTNQPVFIGVDPTGTCTRASNAYLPVINQNTGNIWDCILSPATQTGATATTGEWTAVNLTQLGRARPYKKLAVTATTYTALPADDIIGYNTNVAGTITIPALTGFVGKTYTIQSENTGMASITIATSSGQTINGGASIVIPLVGKLGTNAPYSGITIYTDGRNWFASTGP